MALLILSGMMYLRLNNYHRLNNYLRRNEETEILPDPCVLGFVLLREHTENKTAQDSLCRRDCKSIKNCKSIKKGRWIKCKEQNHQA